MPFTVGSGSGFGSVLVATNTLGPTIASVAFLGYAGMPTSVQHFGSARVRTDESNVSITSMSHMSLDVRVERETTCPAGVASDVASRRTPPLAIEIDQTVLGTQGPYDIRAPNGEVTVSTDELTGSFFSLI